MNKTLASILLMALVATGNPEGAAAEPPNGGAAPDDMPFVFAGIRYGAAIEEAVKRFGKPTRSESVGASEKLFWANDQLEIAFRKTTRLISSITVTGPSGVSAVRLVDNEPILWLLALSQNELIRQLGKPAKIFDQNRRVSWDYEINPKVGASIFFECLNGSAKPCTQMTIQWSGRAIWDPDDGVDALGLRVSPICARTTNAIRILGEKVPTGVTASSEKWELELYENSTSGGWSLIGKSKAEQAPPGGRYCTLASGDRAQSYAETRWYRSYFAR